MDDCPASELCDTSDSSSECLDEVLACDSDEECSDCSENAVFSGTTTDDGEESEDMFSDCDDFWNTMCITFTEASAACDNNEPLFRLIGGCSYCAVALVFDLKGN